LNSIRTLNSKSSALYVMLVHSLCRMFRLKFCSMFPLQQLHLLSWHLHGYVICLDSEKKCMYYYLFMLKVYFECFYWKIFWINFYLKIRNKMCLLSNIYYYYYYYLSILFYITFCLNNKFVVTLFYYWFSVFLIIS